MKDRTDDELREIIVTGDAARAELNRRLSEEADRIEERIAKGEAFAREELRFARGAFCSRCGAKLAYPKRCSPHGAWRCSAFLMGEKLDPEEHDDPKPFAFWSIKSEPE